MNQLYEQFRLQLLCFVYKWNIWLCFSAQLIDKDVILNNLYTNLSRILEYNKH